MSLRWKVAVAMAAIAAVATIAVGVASYGTTRDRLLSEVDRSLIERDVFVANRNRLDPLPNRGPLSGLDAQVVRSDGTVVQSTFVEPLPVGERELAVVGQPRRSVFTTVSTSEGEFRVRTTGFNRGAVQLARPLAETNRVLASLRARTVLLVLAVTAAASAAGWWIAGRVTASLRRLTAAAEQVEATGRFDVDVGETGDDEVGRLGVAFDRMLAALARSRAEQQRLVEDAGHELRTPLTSLRTNLDTLRRYADLPADDRAAVIADLHAETDELTELVDELVAVASGASSAEPVVGFDLGDVAREVADRYARRTGREVRVDAVPAPVTGQWTAIQRAVSCLVDNACKFDLTDGPIDVVVRPGRVTVADRGPGIPDDELDLVFDRFHRTTDARTMPGSGLGLSIVREVARRHSGDVAAANRPGGGAEVGFTLGRSGPA